MNVFIPMDIMPVYSHFLCGQMDRFAVWNWLCFIKFGLALSISMWGEQFQRFFYMGIDILGLLNLFGESEVLLELGQL